MRKKTRTPATDFEYHLPEELIASHPTQRRDDSRLMVIQRAQGLISHATFKDLPSLLKPEDFLVLNDSRVIPGRLFTEDGRFEVLLIEETSPRHWIVLMKPGRKALPGMRLRFARKKAGDGPDIVEAEVLRTLPEGERVVRFFGDFPLEDFGVLPLPPYIVKRRLALGESEQSPEDAERYQTVYSQSAGSVAAPTAGLHFTPELLKQFDHAFVTLHVGIGTFRPVKTEWIEEHVMHEERYVVPSTLKSQTEGRNIVAVGTTVARVLESNPDLKPGSGKTRIFIRPPYAFKRVGSLITNFHLPKSTLLMLVYAFGGRELMREAYAKAVEQRYRFFSYGDSMLILP